MGQVKKYNVAEKKAVNSYLQKLKSISIKDCDIENLQDIRNVKVDSNKSKEERVLQCISLIGNPYCFKVGDMVVKVAFSENSHSFQEKMEYLLKNADSD